MKHLYDKLNSFHRTQGFIQEFHLHVVLKFNLGKDRRITNIKIWKLVNAPSAHASKVGT